MRIILVWYGAVAVAVLCFILYSALFRRERKDRFIPYFFDAIRKMDGWTTLIAYVSIAALLWFPLLAFFLFLLCTRKRR